MPETIRKTIIITIDETETEEGTCNQEINFSTNNMTNFEVLGVLRHYEQRMLASIQQGCKIHDSK